MPKPWLGTKFALAPTSHFHFGGKVMFHRDPWIAMIAWYLLPFLIYVQMRLHNIFKKPPRETLISLHHIQKFPFTIIPIIQYKFNGVVTKK